MPGSALIFGAKNGGGDGAVGVSGGDDSRKPGGKVNIGEAVLILNVLNSGSNSVLGKYLEAPICVVSCAFRLSIDLLHRQLWGNVCAIGGV